MDLHALERQRIAHYQFTQRVVTLNDAARFIDRFGFCWLFAPRNRKLELPALFEAVKGQRNVHIENWDTDSDKVWAWKNDLPAAKRAYYGKALAGKPCFVSLEILPYLLAASGQKDMERAYAHGTISYDTKRVYDALKQFGAQPTQLLKRTAGFVGQDGSARFHKALDELQKNLLALPMGATNEGMAWPSQIFDLVTHWFPAQTRAAQQLDAHDARMVLIERYLKTVLAAPPDAIARMFAIPRPEVKSLLQEMADAKRVSLQEGWVIQI